MNEQKRARSFAMLKKLSRFALIALVALLCGAGLGTAGLYIGGAIGRAVNPRPNVHLYEGIEYVFIGGLVGAGVGLAAGVLAGVRLLKSTHHPEEST
jgi:hypothetical protein